MSQTKPIKTEIKGHEYDMYMLDPLTSHDLMLDVMKMIGPAAGPVMDAVFGVIKTALKAKVEDIGDMEIPNTAFSDAFSKLFPALDKRTIRECIDTFRKITTVDGKPLAKEEIFKLHYTGALDEMHAWLLWGMRVQWGKSLIGLAKETMGWMGPTEKEIP